ncbi:MAG: chitobiase/beta-hexosaminidase C-terminal domain-containing protein [Oscillospiraceae bacterium]|jgi:tetratricopeptide (TPR) repeat protein|nr:chitobiase/beta-hexosaminidase C-terminal domain-containing protein [Oscillospiraceae bacterium]
MPERAAAPTNPDAAAKYRERMRESTDRLASDNARILEPRAVTHSSRAWERARVAARLAEPVAGSLKPSARPSPEPRRPARETRMAVAPDPAATASRPKDPRRQAGEAALAKPIRDAVRGESTAYYAPGQASPYISPRPADQFNWIRLLVLSFLIAAAMTGGSYFFLNRTDQGQFLLASWGRAADADAYARLGRKLMDEGSVPGAVRAFEMALSEDSQNLSILLDLGAAYEANERFDRAELAYRRAISLRPDSSEPYQRVIGLFETQDKQWEAMQCMQYAFDQTGDEAFSQMLARARPDYPRVSAVGAVYATPITIELTTNQPGATIRYTLDGSDPYVGAVYTEPLHMEERDAPYTLRAVTFVDGRVSAEQKQTYTIRTAAPKMPESNLKPGTYDTVRSLALRAESDCVIYYTTDGSPATVNSKVFEPGSLITLRKSSATTVRAIAVAPNGKVSNEMSIRYVCGGTVKTSLMEKDTFDKLTLFSTTRAQFINRFGTPDSVVPGGSDAQGTYSVLYFSFGYAVFRDADDPDASVLAELSVNDDSLKGPRGVTVGMGLSDAMALFRDEGGEDDGSGNRSLYSFISGTAAGNMGMLRRVGEDEYVVRYYTRLPKDYIELAVYASGGVVNRLEWLRYRAPE